MAYVGNQPTQGNFSKLDNISSGFNGATTTFPLYVSSTLVQAGTPQNLIISISGVLQEPGAAYTVSGNSIIFSDAPLSTDTFFGVVLGNVGDINTVSDGTITEVKLGGGSVNLTTKVSGVLPTVNGGTGATSLKTINGQLISGAGDISVGQATTVVLVTGVTQTAVSGTHYVLNNVAATTVTLPISPTPGDTVWITVNNGLRTNIIERNGQTIMNLAENMTIDNEYATASLRFVSSSWRFV